MLEDGHNGRRVYIDETGFNLYTQRTYGRAAIGERVNRIVGSQRGRNITFLVAITVDVGVLHYEVFERGVTKADVEMFVTTLSTILDNERAVIIMDNAPCHRDIQPPSPRHLIHFLPPYSPFLNPIENCFSVLKSHAKQRLAHIQDQTDNRALARQHGMGLMDWRNYLLIREVSQALQNVTEEVVAANVRHADGYLARCVRDVEIRE